jgi:cation:H+ antiporter
MNAYLSIVMGVVCAGIGGELFVRGSVGLAKWMRIPSGIIGATVAAFATSSPELSVAINAGLAGEPNIALGDSLGSNVVNVALILGTALTISGIQAPRSSLKRDFPVALLVPMATALMLLDGVLSRLDGVLLLLGFSTWLSATIVEARRQRSSTTEVLAAAHRWSTIGSCLLGLALLIFAGKFIVTGAQSIATAYGVSQFVIGATLVAVGTSVPELATTVIAKIKGHDEIGLGTVLGSNIFNGLFVVGLVAVIHPIQVAWHSVFVALLVGIVALICSFPPRTGFIDRRRGVLLIAAYCIYLAVVLQQPTQ